MKQVNFVSVHIDVATKIILEQDTIHEDDAIEWALSLVPQNYKVSFSYNVERDSYIASLTGKEGTKNDGLCISQWAGSIGKAAQKLHLIHHVICGGDNWGMADGKLDEILREALGSFKR